MDTKAAGEDTPLATADYLSIPAAAARLSTTPDALRARCRRSARRIGKNRVVAQLGGGIAAIKLGTSWRIRFPPVEG